MYLIGSYAPQITGAKLPSYRQALGYFLHLHKDQKLTVRNASSAAVQAVANVGEKRVSQYQAVSIQSRKYKLFSKNGKDCRNIKQDHQGHTKRERKNLSQNLKTYLTLHMQTK